MNKMSIKLKVTLWYTFAMVLLSAIVLFAMNSFGYKMVEKDITGRIVQTVNEISKKLLSPQGSFHAPRESEQYNRGVYILTFDCDCNLLSGTLPFGITDELTFSNDELRKASYNDSTYYEYDRQIITKDNTYWVKGFVSSSEESYAVKSVTKNNIIVSGIMILLASVFGYFLINKALYPISKIVKTAKQISQSNNISQRINIDEGYDEIHSLANTFDEMLDKIEYAFNREKQFTSDASHELRTPIAVILSECEYMEECAKTIDEYKNSEATVKRQAERMSKLISQLLTISRMDRNTLKTNFEEIDLSELITFVCDEQAEIRNKNVLLKRNIKEGVMVFGDRFLLTRMFINLISNAYQYIGNGDEIKVVLEESDGEATFSVCDNGIGISEENLQKIWERFYQVDTSRTSTDSGSMGLGLSMVKWIGEAHGGKLTATSALGVGSTFCFTIKSGKSTK